jgi:Na+-transporting NADH:ubiquinone oxidoreductase subunit A
MSSGKSTSTAERVERRLSFVLKKGLDLPISGPPELTVDNGAKVRQVALLGADYVGLKPTMAVEVGDSVKLGELLFTDKKNPGVRYTSPGAGTVSAINRGEKRALLSVVIDLEGEEEETFASYSSEKLPTLTRAEVTANLVASGLWTALRARPYSKVPSPESVPHSIFVNAMDTDPLANPPFMAAQGRDEDLRHGLTVLAKLTDGPLFLCHAPEESPAGAELDCVTPASFEGPHPAGLVGTHIHFLDPVSTEKTVWHLKLQEVLAIGALFTTGRIDVGRVVALAGPMSDKPRLLRTRLGACTDDLIIDELSEPTGEGAHRHCRIRPSEGTRVVSGSLLMGHTAKGPHSYLGRYDLQICAIEEFPKRVFLEWHHPGIDRFSVTRLFISTFLRVSKFRFTTCTNGSARAMVPIGTYEKVMPLDILPTFLLRALIVGDTDQAQALGCLELDEEDLALCTFSCPAKYDFGPILRKNLTQIEIEG